MAAEPDSTGFNDYIPSEWYEVSVSTIISLAFVLRVQYLLNPNIATPEMFAFQNAPDLAPPSILPNFLGLYEFLEASLDMQPIQEATSDSTLVPYSDFDPSNSLSRTAAPADVDDTPRICPTCSAPTSLPPSLPVLQAPTFLPPKWHKIPQGAYNHGRKQWDYTQLEPILFQVNGYPGVNMGEAFRNKFTALEGRDDLILPDARTAVSCRLSVRLSCWLYPLS
jgi:hypothetical protein